MKLFSFLLGEEYRILRKELLFGSTTNPDIVISLPTEEEIRDISVACLGDLR